MENFLLIAGVIIVAVIILRYAFRLLFYVVLALVARFQVELVDERKRQQKKYEEREEKQKERIRRVLEKHPYPSEE